MKVILGMGCDRDTSQHTLESAIDLALQQASLTRDAIHSLASIDKKKDEIGLLSLSSEHNWPLYFYSAEQLAHVEVPNPSEIVRKHMGTPAVAEAAALLAANTDMKNLIVEKYKYCGEDNKHATVSIVRMRSESIYNE
ncbi:MAG: cobalamin biosynthesis protein [Gammaproteobacteria bacterium]|nr:cobalamin biosynthesis protein [Gammaproteobacteria bacterium]